MGKRRIKDKKHETAYSKQYSNLPVGLSLGYPLPGIGLTMDGFSNPLARMGSGTQNLLEATQYTMSKMTRNSQLINTLYRENWIIKRIIDTMPEDMIKNWYKIETQLPPDDIRRFARLERTTNIRAKILEGLRWGRLYGGAAAVIIIDGQDDILDQPLELDMIMPGSFKGLIILDRWSGISPSLGLVTDINDINFGLPEYYIITSDELGTGIKVHHSRILRFIGRDLPYIEKVGEQYWGASELEHVYEELKKRDNTSWNIASLIFSANLKVYKMDGMEQIALLPEKQQLDLYKTLSCLNMTMNSNGMQVIGMNDSFETHQYSFSGLSDIYELFMLDIAGAAETPVTKLFGRSPAGMNATGESDMQNYYDTIEEKQESYLRPVIDRLLPIMCMSEFGAVPDDLDYSFVSCRRPTEQEKKNLAQQVAGAVNELYNSGIISHRIALKELKQSSELTGMWSNITDEDIDRASDSFEIGGEYSEIEFPNSKPDEIDLSEGQESTVSEIANILNGAQGSSLVGIVQSVNSGALPRSSGIAMIMSAFGYTQEKAEEVMGNAGLEGNSLE